MQNKVPIKVKMTTDNVKECLIMKLAEEDLRDLTLGKSGKINCSNNPKKGDENLVFGLNTNKLNAMNDLALEMCTVKDIFAQNSYEIHQLSQKEIDLPRTKDEIKGILKDIGVDYKAGMFEGIWLKSIELESKCPLDQVTKNEVSIKSFLKAIRELRIYE